MIGNIEILKSVIRSFGHTSVKVLDDKRLIVIVKDGTERNRANTLMKLGEQLREQGERFYYYRTHNASSAGALMAYGKYVIFANPSEQTNKHLFHSGMKNEEFLVNTINDYRKRYSESLDVCFVSQSGKKYLIKNVEKVNNDDEARGVQYKSDITITGNSKQKYPISLKKDNAEFWENSQTLFGDDAKKIIDYLVLNNKVKLLKHGSNYDIRPRFSVLPSPSQAKKVVFGDDVSKPNGRVIIRSFSDGDFIYKGDENTLYVHCTYIYNTINDIAKDHKPYFTLVKEAGRGTTKLYKGLKVVATFKTRVAKNNILLSDAEVKQIVRTMSRK